MQSVSQRADSLRVALQQLLKTQDELPRRAELESALSSLDTSISAEVFAALAQSLLSGAPFRLLREAVELTVVVCAKPSCDRVALLRAAPNLWAEGPAHANRDVRTRTLELLTTLAPSCRSLSREEQLSLLSSVSPRLCAMLEERSMTMAMLATSALRELSKHVGAGVCAEAELEERLEALPPRCRQGRVGLAVSEVLLRCGVLGLASQLGEQLREGLLLEHGDGGDEMDWHWSGHGGGGVGEGGGAAGGGGGGESGGQRGGAAGGGSAYRDGAGRTGRGGDVDADICATFDADGHIGGAGGISAYGRHAAAAGCGRDSACRGVGAAEKLFDASTDSVMLWGARPAPFNGTSGALSAENTGSLGTSATAATLCSSGESTGMNDAGTAGRVDTLGSLSNLSSLNCTFRESTLGNDRHKASSCSTASKEGSERRCLRMQLVILQCRVPDWLQRVRRESVCERGVLVWRLTPAQASELPHEACRTLYEFALCGRARVPPSLPPKQLVAVATAIGARPLLCALACARVTCPRTAQRLAPAPLRSFRVLAGRRCRRGARALLLLPRHVLQSALSLSPPCDADGLSLLAVHLSSALDNCNYRDNGDSISPCDSDGSFDTTDVDFVLRDGTISAHRCVLCARSEYFARMFRWGEGSQNDTTAARAQPRVRIRVPDACCAAFRSLLRFAYCSSISPLSSKRDDVAAVAADSAIMHDDAREAWDETTGGRLEPMREVETKPAQNQLSGTEALELVLLARRYMMEELVDKGAEALRSAIRPSDVVPLLLQAQQHGCDDDLELVSSWAAAHYEEVSQQLEQWLSSASAAPAVVRQLGEEQLLHLQEQLRAAMLRERYGL